MTTYMPFVPTQTAPFQFQTTLDGGSYLVTATWNFYRQGWFLNVYDASSILVVAIPMVGSPPGYNISLVAGYFASTLVFRASTQSFEVNP